MDAEVKALWVTALRSGEYSQGRGALHNRTTNTYCCLGVLCDLGTKHFNVHTQESEPLDDSSHRVTVYDGMSGVLPWKVVTWAGLGNTDPELYELHEVIRNYSRVTLTSLNDNFRLSFDQIADIIEYFL